MKNILNWSVPILKSVLIPDARGWVTSGGGIYLHRSTMKSCKLLAWVLGLILVHSAPRVHAQETGREMAGLIRQALQDVDAGRYEDAVRNFNAAYPYSKRSRVFIYYYALSLDRLGRDNEAESAYREVLHERPDQTRSKYAELRSVLFGANMALGNFSAGRKDWSMALNYYSQANANGSIGWEAPFRIGKVLVDGFKDHQSAIPYFDQVLKRAPREPATRRYLSTCYAELGVRMMATNPSAAKEMLLRAMGYDSTSTLAASNYKTLLEREIAAAASAAALRRTQSNWDYLGIPSNRALAFFAALEKSDTSKVAAMLAEEPNLAKAKSQNGEPALHCARTGEVAEALLLAGAGIHARAEDGALPIHRAVTREDTGVLDVLLQKHVDVDSVATTGQTPLHSAVIGFVGPTETIVSLLFHGAKPDTVDALGRTPLMEAARIGNRVIVDLLIAGGADLSRADKVGKTALDYSRESVSADLANYLQTLGSLGSRPREAMEKALRAKDLAAFKRVMQVAPALAVAPGRNGRTLLHVAASAGFVDGAKLLIKGGTKIDARDREGATAILAATVANNDELVSLLLSAGADPTIRDKYNSSPVLEAVGIGARTKCLKVLLSAGADANEAGPMMPALFMAVGGGAAENVTLLIEHGANPNFRVKNGWTPLHLSGVACAEPLIKHQANVNANSQDGTPLHVSIGRSDFEMVKLLVSHGADLSLRDAKNRTPIEVANGLVVGLEGEELKLVKQIIACLQAATAAH